jgi:hypothetical protein
VGLYISLPGEEKADLWLKGVKGRGELVFFGILRLRLAQSAAPNFAQDDGFYYGDSCDDDYFYSVVREAPLRMRLLQHD